MADRVSLKKLTYAKLKAAKILYVAGDYDTSGYLIGYVVELALKACICKKLNLTVYPATGKHYDIFAKHDLDRLLVLSGYSEEINLALNQDLFKNWSILTKDWSTSTRYDLNLFDKTNIEEKLNALEKNSNSFLAWIKKKW